MPTSPHAGAFAAFARLRVAFGPERFDPCFIRVYKTAFYRAFCAWLIERDVDELVTPSTS